MEDDNKLIKWKKKWIIRKNEQEERNKKCMMTMWKEKEKK